MNKQLPRRYKSAVFPDGSWKDMVQPEKDSFLVPLSFRESGSPIHGTNISCVASFEEKTGPEKEKAVVVKRILLNGTRKTELAFREIACLLAAEHHNHVVNLIRAYCPQKWYKNASKKDQLYFVFDPTDGNLVTYIAEMKEKEGGCSHVAISRILAQLTDALIFLHNKCRIIHRDLKPANVGLHWMRKKEEELEAKLFDFGHSVALLIDEKGKVMERPPSAKRGIGTGNYRSPEFLVGLDMGAPVDVWGLGCILYHMMTGEELFPLHLQSDASAEESDRPKKRPPVNVPKQLEAILSRVGSEGITQQLIDQYKEKADSLVVRMLQEKMKSQQPVNLVPKELKIRGEDGQDRTDENCKDLLIKMLNFNSKERMTLGELEAASYLAAVGHQPDGAEPDKSWYESIKDEDRKLRGIRHWKGKIREILKENEQDWKTQYEASTERKPEQGSSSKK